jgi:thiamine-phosphate pyrophosphorylase
MADRCLLYYITDRSQFRGNESARRRALLEKIAEATRAGVEYIQLREKDLGARELEILAKEALTAVRDSVTVGVEPRKLETRLLINSRTDVALAVGADGVHLRADDVSPGDVRSVLEDSGQHLLPTGRLLVAASCHTNEDVIRAGSEEADFVVFAPVFGKSNAPGTQPLGLDVLREACRSKINVFALGGITVENAASCLDAGAVGVAGIRLFQENKIEDVVRALRAI